MKNPKYIIEPKYYRAHSLYLLPCLLLHTEKYWGVRRGITLAFIFFRLCFQVTIWRAQK